MKNFKHLSHSEREEIFLLLNQGRSYREIGKLLDRDHSTIRRETRRNTPQATLVASGSLGEYSPSKAEELADARQREARRRKLDDESIRSFIIGKLSRGWSPEQIAGRLKLKAPNCSVSHETIYQFIYAPENKSLRLWEFLRRGRKSRQPLFSRKSQCQKKLKIPGRTPIEARPQEATLRKELGHFETDLLEGRKEVKEVISALVDRKTRYLALDKLPNKGSLLRAEVLASRLRQLPIFPKTLTMDNGLENYHHELVIQKTGCQTYFCQPYHAWEKGTVENTIGLVRSYIPKGTDLGEITNTDLNTISWELNNRPRKTLGFYTPLEVLYNQVDTGAFQP